MNKSSVMDRIKSLLDYRQELVTEEKLLKKILAQMQEQIHVLQVEQFHLSGIINKTAEKSPEHVEEDPLVIETLDLEVPMHVRNCFEEEEEQDEDK